MHIKTRLMLSGSFPPHEPYLRGKIEKKKKSDKTSKKSKIENLARNEVSKFEKISRPVTKSVRI